MSKQKETIPSLSFEDLKVGQVYRAKKPKMIGIFDPLVDDRQILYISQHKSPVDHIDHGYTLEYLEWCKKTGNSSWPSSELTQCEYERETNKEAKRIETVWDYQVQYDSPSVKYGKKHPTIPAQKFLKWAAKNVTEIMPKGEWAKEF
jgi:hypothetical protein